MTEPTLSQDLRDAADQLRAWTREGCPICYGDCAGANPPVTSCPIQSSLRLAARLEAAIPVIEAAVAMAVDVLEAADMGGYGATTIAASHGLIDKDGKHTDLGRQLLALKIDTTTKDETPQDGNPSRK